MEPQIQYCTTSDGVSIAYAVAGDGPPLLYTRSGGNHLALDWQLPGSRLNYEWLARRYTLVRFDRRGEGLSQRDDVDFNYALDMEAVARSLGLQRFAIFAFGSAVRWAIEYAAAHPEQVTRMVLWNGWPSGKAIMADPRVAALVGLIDQDWVMYTETYASVVGAWEDPASARDRAAIMRAAITQERQRRTATDSMGSDTTALLPSVVAPTLVVHIRESIVPIAAARALTAGIPNARLQSIEGKSVVSSFADHDIAPWLEAFLSDEEIHATTSREAASLVARSAVTTVLFTDIVGHTEMMQRLGDAKGRDVLREHERITRETLRAHGGAEVKTDGDGFMATFQSVTAAVECALALQRAFAQHSESGGELIVVRMGLNVGEPIEENGDFFGSSVILGSRIKDQAGGGEILVPEAVRHMLSGKGFKFSDRGEFALKGFDDAVRLYEVRWRD